MSLHLVFSPQGMRSCLARWSPDDCLILIGDGVYGAYHIEQTNVEASSVAVLDSDTQARGVSGSEYLDLRRIDYMEFVSLTEQHSPIVSWKD
ncbi:sulfurtransferase complex subunit TusB [Gammaproteobacteria bacterium]|nr:sulfurtransferase complex subunit TusB [Gammaproteobacteria bacterium]